MKKDDLSTFDPKADFSIIERGLPHWSQAGTICFITWRLCDSLPSQVLDQLDKEIESLLAQENLSLKNWKSELASRDSTQRGKVQWKLFQIRDKFLDQGSGKCWLARPECAIQVMDSLKHFDELRYFLTDAVVMPNHIHFLCAFAEEDEMLKQCEDWKRYTARNINRLVGRSGEFWQVDQFDHLIRSPDQFDHYRRYLFANPLKAGLKDDQFLYFAKDLT